MSLTVYADGQKAYAAYDVTTAENRNKTGDALTALQVNFNGKSWYIIADGSTAVNAGTVTLLAVENLGTSKFHDSSNAYSTSTIKTTLDNMTASGGSFAEVASAINTVKVKGSDSDAEVDAKLYLLSYAEASVVPVDVRKFSTHWWLRTPGGDEFSDVRAEYVLGFGGPVGGYINTTGDPVSYLHGIRPALQLNLSKVVFDSSTKTFSLRPNYEVTYKVVNGTWSDDSTADKTETVQSGSKPASVPTGMKAASGYTGGAWDTNPTDATITGATTFTYTFTAKQAATVTKAPAAKNLTYTGSAQELVTAGEATGGTMQYALGTDATTAPTSGWSTYIPTGTDAKSYFVWYKAKGDSNHTDSAAACVTATISPLSISGATVTLDKSEIPYTGSELGVSVTGVKLGNTELTAKDYEVSGTTKATDKGTYTVTVTGKGNYKDTASAQWTITDGKADGQVQAEGFNTSVKIKQKSGKLIISWDKVAGVSKVEVYAAYCGKNFSSKPAKTTAGNKVTIKKLKGKELDFTKNFKLRLIAYDSNGKKIGKIPNPHFVGKDNEKYTNAKSIKLSKTQIILSAGQSEKIKASVKREDKNKKLLPKKHVDKFRYRSTNSNVAKVDSNGNITGVGAGTCEVYVYAQNGLAKKVAVTVN